MLLQFLFGTLVSAITIGIHALVTIVAVSIARTAGLRPMGRPRLHLMGVMIATAAVLQIAHTLEILVWAGAYAVVQAAVPGSGLLYSLSSTTPRLATATSRRCGNGGSSAR